MNEDVEKKRERMLQSEIEHLEETAKSWVEYAKEQERHMASVRGVALGLIFGIVGNLVVQHWYPVFEGLMLGKYDILFLVNAIVCVLAFFTILYLISRFLRQLDEAWKQLRAAYIQESEARFGIVQRKRLLERRT